MSLTFSSGGAAVRRAALLLSVAATVVCTAPAAAQVKPAPQSTRDSVQKKHVKKALKHRTGAAKATVSVPVRKERTEGGEVLPVAAAPVNQDSLIRAARERDSVAAAEAARAADRAIRDSLDVIEQAGRARAASNELLRMEAIGRAAAEAQRQRDRLRRYHFYWGVAGGASAPSSDLTSDYGVGYNVTVPVGWDLGDIPFGLRVDASYDRLAGKSAAAMHNSDVQVFSLNGDIKYRMLSLPQVASDSRFYVVGGVGVHRFVADGGNPPGTVTPATSNNGFATSFPSAKGKFGWNAGAGLSFGIGSTALFVESRYFSVTTDNVYAGTTGRFVPVILGITF